MTAVSLAFQTYFSPNSLLYNLAYFVLVVVFTFFYSSVVVNVHDVADNLKKSGSFIPGISSGSSDGKNISAASCCASRRSLPSTSACSPSYRRRYSAALGVTTFYLGSTSLLIVVGVALDTMTQI